MQQNLHGHSTVRGAHRHLRQVPQTLCAPRLGVLLLLLHNRARRSAACRAAHVQFSAGVGRIPEPSSRGMEDASGASHRGLLRATARPHQGHWEGLGLFWRCGLLTLMPFLQADKKQGLPPPSNLEMNRDGVEVDKESKKKTTKLHSLVIRHVMTDSLPNVARGSATLVIHPKEPVLKVMCVSLTSVPLPLDCDDNLRCATGALRPFSTRRSIRSECKWPQIRAAAVPVSLPFRLRRRQPQETRPPDLEGSTSTESRA